MDRTVPAGAALLLDFVGGIEAPRGYDVIYGNNQDKLPKPITQMTIGELVDAQASFTKRFKSSASGRYQLMRATLQGLARELGLRGTQLFDANLQDRLGFHLLKRRGYEDFMAGKISRTEFGKRLAQEWASFPVLAAVQGAHRKLKRGETYYAGDELNKALVKPEAVEALLDKVKAAGNAVTPLPNAPSDEPEAPSSPETAVTAPVSASFWADLFKAILSFFGKAA